MAKTRADEIKEKFIQYHNDHPEVWGMFMQFALEAIASGRVRFSSKAIIERIRWEKDIAQKSEDAFKISNDCTPYYPRMFMALYPEYTGFFKTKKLISQNGKAKDYETGMLDFDAPPEDEEELTEELRQLAIKSIEI